MHALFRYNPEAYLDEKGIAHVMMPERQEGIGGPRVSRMADALRIPHAQAERLRARMTKSDDIEDILRDAARVAKARPEPVYYASVNDMDDFTDGILFVDFGDPKRMTLVFDYRDGRFVINDVGPSLARQKGRFAKANPARGSRRDRPEFSVYLTYVNTSRQRRITAGFASDAAAKRALREVREVMENYTDLSVSFRLLRRDDLLAAGIDPSNARNWDTSGR